MQNSIANENTPTEWKINKTFSDEGKLRELVMRKPFLIEGLKDVL